VEASARSATRAPNRAFDEDVDGLHSVLHRFMAASSAASWAAKGVDLREPLNPFTPDDDHDTTLPDTSVMVTIVLLNDAVMCAMPL